MLRSDARTVCLLILASGFAALSWEVLWQIKASLALGVSAWGTAITLAVIMSGMSLGGYLMGNALNRASGIHAVRLYGLIEVIIGLSGLLLNNAFLSLEKLDTWAFARLPESISIVYIGGMIAVFGIPALCMGATLPLFGSIARQYQLSLAKLYSLNTAGAAAGSLVVALLLLPSFGVAKTISIIAAINIITGVLAWLLTPAGQLAAANQPQAVQDLRQSTPSRLFIIVFVTGFATFTLEVAWFRSLASVLPNTTDVFAAMLACTLAALALGAKSVSGFRRSNNLPDTQICLAGALILVATPLIERLNNVFAFSKQAGSNGYVYSGNLYSLLLNPDSLIVNNYAVVIYSIHLFVNFGLIFLIIVPPLRFLGVAFPWVIDQQHSSNMLGKLYAVNAVSAILGSISAAWVLLPAIGFARTAWIAGVLVLLAGLYISKGRKRLLLSLPGMAALAVAICFETGVGKSHVLGYFATDDTGRPARVLEFHEGPDASASAVEYADGSRALLINSTLAALESGTRHKPSAHYMQWMGHLPMLLAPNSRMALVICFGTGQTANAVRKENPGELDIVDINRNVFRLARHFRANEGVLADSRVKTFVMDGRAYMRRTAKQYDVITLEPMPPGTIGVNALYSREFYQLARGRLSASGVIAQWLPFNGVGPYYTASIAKTFREVFPNAILWIDTDSRTGILLGSKDDKPIPADKWPGFARGQITRDMSDEQILRHIALGPQDMEKYSAYGQVVTDDNQLLAYGKALYATGMAAANFELLHRIKGKMEFPGRDS